jgi:hypothetical protein
VVPPRSNHQEARFKLAVNSVVNDLAKAPDSILAQYPAEEKGKIKNFPKKTNNLVHHTKKCGDI